MMAKKLRDAPNPQALPIAPVRGERIIEEDGGYPTLRFAELLEQLVNIATGQQIIIQADDYIETNVSWISFFNKRIKELQAEIDALNVQVTALEGRVTVLEAEVATLQGQMTALTSRVNDLELQVLMAAPSAV